MGYFTIDNLPVPLVDDFLHLTNQTNEGINDIALVMDARAIEYLDLMPITVQRLRDDGHTVVMVYLEAAEEILARRFNETRRKHPLSPDDSPTVGIRKEIELLKKLRAFSDHVIDSSSMTVHELKKLIHDEFQDIARGVAMAVRISSFGFRHGAPADADLVFDVRFLPNPFFREELRELSGHDQAVQDFVFSTEVGNAFREKIRDFIGFLIPKYQDEGKAYLHIAIGCTGGQHRSVALAQDLSKYLTEKFKDIIASVKTSDRDLKNTN